MKKRGRPFSARRVALAVVAVVALAALLYACGRPLWRPLVVTLAGGASSAERIRHIEASHPSLAGMAVRSMAVLCFKQELRVEVYCDDRPYRSFPILAASGKPGPKLREGDRQVPEGVYAFDAMNPESAYHLSLRVSYPNADDLRRAQAAGVVDAGGEIYVHGGNASIGCIAIGDEAIEEVFWIAAKVGLKNTVVIIAPRDFRVSGALPDGPDRDLYAQIAQRLSRYQPGIR